MKYLILSDIHSNLEALTEALKLAAGRYDKVICLGDLVGYGPDPNAVVEKIRELGATAIRGNHDKVCCGVEGLDGFNPLAKTASLWTQEQLTPENLEYLRKLPPGPVQVDWFEIFHGSWLDEDEYIIGPGEALPSLEEMPSQLGLFGHTHILGGFMWTKDRVFHAIHWIPEEGVASSHLSIDEGARYLVNPGSVGQPRDGDWRAGFALFDSDERRIEYLRTPYDLPKTQEKMRQANLPAPLARRLQLGR